MRELIIFGAGDFGHMAYCYYKWKIGKNSYYKGIKCFVDNSREKWGLTWHGVKICSPEILYELDSSDIVVIANKRRKEEIKKQLREQYGIRQVLVFDVSSTDILLACEEEDCTDASVVIYKGGLGNTMFQYAFARCLEQRGHLVLSDISFYGDTAYGFKFELVEFFPEVRLKAYTDLKDKKEVIVEEQEFQADEKFLKLTNRIYDGYWQSWKYVQAVESELRRDFRFPLEKEEKLVNLAGKIKEGNYTSISFRCGDYLSSKELGNLCNRQYYQEAMQYIKEHRENVKFIVFSDDIAWVKENAGLDEDTIYVEASLFDDYRSWYDLYFMQLCKNNIIANSTFSWWGAWLNQTEDKIVIAPKTWIRSCDAKEICPPDWIRI